MLKLSIVGGKELVGISFPPEQNVYGHCALLPGLLGCVCLKRSNGICPKDGLAPIVYDVDARPVVARFVGTMHRDALDLDAEAACEQDTVRFVAAQVRPGD